MTKVYVLSGYVIHEGSSYVLGVYTSLEEAFEGERKWRENNETMDFDDYDFDEFVLNGEPTH